MSKKLPCKSTRLTNNYTYICEKMEGHQGYHKSGFHAW